MKKEYIKPELKEEVIELEDIIATSGEYDPNGLLENDKSVKWW